ncbi:hypothetical protein [Wolbachia endosymbiont of Folsomia candida]|uniref:hypothetical protein n=1 Tax=Wolbachia endosymbiont of Folsomia candida TaxID=169402 RepID=UPI000A519921|nr:hypothetical protein [Wolbachia endosymbiont of Folsomia candida]APR98984.1 hypothetical protein ASM33_07295 [Wolbachia endosymbiont of Folsomia candida]
MTSYMNKSREEIKALLVDSIEEYLLYLIPDGEFYKGKFYIGDLCGDKVIVETTGERAGDWYKLAKIKGDVVEFFTFIAGDRESAEELYRYILEKYPAAFSVKH